MKALVLPRNDRWVVALDMERVQPRAGTVYLTSVPRKQEAEAIAAYVSRLLDFRNTEHIMGRHLVMAWLAAPEIDPS